MTHDPLSELLPPPLRQLLRGRALTLQRPVWGQRAGRHMSRRAGHGLEFRGHRPYSPGDDLRRLDWRAVARRDRLVYRETHSEDALDLLLMIDDSGGMAYGEGPQNKLRAAAAIAAALAVLAIRQGDRVGLGFASDTQRSRGLELARPVGGRRRLQAIAAALAEAQGRPQGACAWPDALDRVLAYAPRRCMLVLLGDLLDPDPRASGSATADEVTGEDEVDDEDARAAADPGERRLQDALGRLRARGLDVVIAQVLHRDELTFPWSGRELLRLEDSRGVRPAVEGAGQGFREGYLRRLNAYLGRLERSCERERVHLARVVTDAPVSDSVLDLLAHLSGSPASRSSASSPAKSSARGGGGR